MRAQQALQRQQNSSEAVMANIQDFVDLESAAAELEEAGDLLDAENDAPIVRLLNAILAESLKESASDIHIEPYEKEALGSFPSRRRSAHCIDPLHSDRATVNLAH